MCKLGVISQERLKIKVRDFVFVTIALYKSTFNIPYHTIPLSANRKSYIPRRLAQQMTLNDLEWQFQGSASRAISAVAELLVIIFDFTDLWTIILHCWSYLFVSAGHYTNFTIVLLLYSVVL